MLDTIKAELSEAIKQRSLVLVELSYKGINQSIIFDEIEVINKLKLAYDTLEEV